MIQTHTTNKGRVSLEIEPGDVLVKTPWLPDFTPLDDIETNERGMKELAVSHDNDDLAVLCVYSEVKGARLIPEGSHKITLRRNGKDESHVLTYAGKNKLYIE